MDRIDTRNFHTKPKHQHSIIELSGMVIDLRTCLKAKAPIDPATRQNAIFTIDVARRDIERCRTPIEDMLKGDGSDYGSKSIADFYMIDHVNCIMLITNLSLMLKLNKPYDADILDSLDAEIVKLEDCRQDMRLYRHVRGRGYVR